jgi:hypothetical protein
MLQSCHVALLGIQATGYRLRPALDDTLLALNNLELHVKAYADPPGGLDWIDGATLVAPESEPLAGLLRRFKASGFAFNRRAASASLMLRYGWAAGFLIAAYLTRRRVPVLHDYSLHFSSGSLLRGIWIRDADFIGLAGDPLAGGPEWIESVSERVLRVRLLEQLLGLTEPVIAAHHAWSRFSRHALWAMATSSWGGQFANVARQLGDEPRGVEEARALFALAPEIARAAPELYEVRSGGAARTCQKLSACCLYFKSSDNRQFCACCPIIPEAERLERNRSWVTAQAPRACNSGEVTERREA